MKGEKGRQSSSEGDHRVLHHHLPPGDGDEHGVSPYVRAKHLQLVEKDPDAAIVFFWKAINVGDRVDSALKDMAVVMKQQDRAEEAIEAIRSFRERCSAQAQESLDNVLIDLYKKCGRLEEQIELMEQKLWMICRGAVFNGKPMKTARSHGKKFRVTVEQETSRILGNLGWAYMQLGKYAAAELVYRKAQLINPDSNKACNLACSLIKQARYAEARSVLEDVLQCTFVGSDDPKSRSRAEEMMFGLPQSPSSPERPSVSLGDPFIEGIDHLMREQAQARSKRLPIFEEISPFRDQFVCRYFDFPMQVPNL